MKKLTFTPQEIASKLQKEIDFAKTFSGYNKRRIFKRAHYLFNNDLKRNSFGFYLQQSWNETKSFQKKNDLKIAEIENRIYFILNPVHTCELPAQFGMTVEYYNRSKSVGLLGATYTGD